MPDWYLYIIRTNSGDLYTGISYDVDRRFSEHESGSSKAARFLRGKAPLQLVFKQRIGSRSQALKAEAAVKKLPKSLKEDLVNGRQSLDVFLDSDS